MVQASSRPQTVPVQENLVPVRPVLAEQQYLHELTLRPAVPPPEFYNHDESARGAPVQEAQQRQSLRQRLGGTAIAGADGRIAEWGRRARGTLVRTRDKVMAWGNAVVGAVELPASTIGGGALGVADGSHNIFHALSYRMQQKLIERFDTPTGEAGPVTEVALPDRASRFDFWSRTKHRARAWLGNTENAEQLSYGLISVPAIGAIALLANNTMQRLTSESNHEGLTTMDYMHIGSTGAAFALTAGLMGSAMRMRRNLKRTNREHTPLAEKVGNYYRDARDDGVVSGLATAEALAHSLAGASTSALVAMNAVSALVAAGMARRFWPTKRNIARQSELQAKRKAARHTGEGDHGHAHDHHEHKHHDHGNCNHGLDLHEMADKAKALGRTAGALGSVALSAIAGTGERAVGAGRGWLQARKDARQAEIWRQWVEDTSNPDTPLGRWAASKLALDKDEYDQWKHKKEQTEYRTSLRRRWRTALAAGTAAVALGAGLAGDAADKVVEAEPSAPEGPVAVQPVQPPAPVEEVPPPKQAPFTETVEVDPGDSQWSLAEERVGPSAQAAVIKIAAALAAAENARTNPNPHHIAAGQNLAVLSDEAVQAVHDAYNNPDSPLQPKLEDLIQAEWDEVIELVGESGINLQIQAVARSS